MKTSKFKQTEIGMIPEDWELAKVGLKCKIKNGKTNSQDAVENGIFPLFDRSSQIKRSNKFLFDCEAIIVPGEGKEFNPRYFKGKFDLHQRAYAIWTERENIDLKFVYYWILKNRNYLTRIAVGSTVKSLRLNHLENFPIGLPNTKEQRAIAKILSDLDAKIELLQRQNETLEKIGQAIFKHWFVDFEFPNEEGKPYKSSGGEMVYNEELGKEIPKGWVVSSLDKTANYLNGLALQKYPPKGKDDLPVIKIRELKQGITEATDLANSDIPKEYVVNDGDILFSWSGSLEVVIWCDGKGALNQHLFKVTSDKYPKWFYYYWTLHHLKQFKRIAEDKATTMGHIKRKHLSEAKVLIPTKEKLEELNKIFNPIIEKQIMLKVQARTLARIRDLLLPKLMTGKIRVPLEINR